MKTKLKGFVRKTKKDLCFGVMKNLLNKEQSLEHIGHSW